jgi:hypothetical protein
VRDEAMRDMYNLADQVVRATEGLYEMDGPEPVLLRDSWIDLAQRLPHTEDVDTPRKAVLFLTGGDQRLHFLAAEWGEWTKAGKPLEDEEVARDFVMTR